MQQNIISDELCQSFDWQEVNIIHKIYANEYIMGTTYSSTDYAHA